FLKSREDAIREVSEALHSAGETYADSPEFWTGACELSLALGLFDDAERALEKLQTMPAARGVSLLTARVLSAKGKPEEALAYAETAVNELRGAERQKALEFRNRLPGWNPDGEGDGDDASHD